MLSWGLVIRLQVQRKHFNVLRVEIGNMRQRTNDANPIMQQMQQIVGEIEDTLYRCEKLVS